MRSNSRTVNATWSSIVWCTSTLCNTFSSSAILTAEFCVKCSFSARFAAKYCKFRLVQYRYIMVAIHGMNVAVNYLKHRAGPTPSFSMHGDCSYAINSATLSCVYKFQSGSGSKNRSGTSISQSQYRYFPLLFPASAEPDGWFGMYCSCWLYDEGAP